MKEKKITIETPCTVSELEHLLTLVEREGHWHDVEIVAVKGKVVISYKDDMDQKGNPAR